MDCLDAWKYLSQWLDDTDKFNLMVTSHRMKLLNLLFNEEHHYKSIICSTFYENFTNIVIDNIVLLMGKKFIKGRLPPYSKNVKRLRFSNSFNHRVKSFMIPSTITHLKFGRSFYYSIKSGIIPSTVTHLVFGTNYPCNISDCISPSLVYLDMGMAHFGHCSSKKGKSSNYDQKMLPSIITHLFWKRKDIPKNIIPTSVKYLSIHTLSNEIVPSSVTHLTIESYEDSTIFPKVTHFCFGKKFAGIIKKIPSSVTHIKFANEHNPIAINTNKIPTSVTHIFISECCVGELDSLPSSVTNLILPEYWRDKNNVSNSIKNVIKYDDAYLDKSDYSLGSVSQMMIDQYYDDSEDSSYELDSSS